MIIHLLSLLGCLAGCIVFLIMEIFSSNSSGIPFWQGAIGFLVLFFLVYWNLCMELKKAK